MLILAREDAGEEKNRLCIFQSIEILYFQFKVYVKSWVRWILFELRLMLRNRKLSPIKTLFILFSRIRAIYGLDIMRNGLHASSNNKHAREEIRLLFPDYEFIKTKPIPFHSLNSSSLFFSFYD